MTFPLRDAPSRDTHGGIAVDTAILASNFQDGAQSLRCGYFGPGAYGEIGDELLNLCTGDFINEDVSEMRFDAQLPLLGVTAPRLWRHCGLFHGTIVFPHRCQCDTP